MAHTKPHTKEARGKISESKTGNPNIKIRRDFKIENGFHLYQCGICKDYKHRIDFYKADTIIGIEYACIDCRKKYWAERYQRMKRKVPCPV